jgi:hypothetical protein
MFGLKAFEAAVIVAIFVKRLVHNKHSRYFGFGMDARNPTWTEAFKATIEGK